MREDAATEREAPHLTAEELQRGEVLLARIVDFARLLWELGLDVGPGRVIDVARSLPLINVGRRAEFYACLKVTLVSKHEQEPLFDAAFAYFWRPPAGSPAYHEMPEDERARVRRVLSLPSHRSADDAPKTTRFGLRATEQQRHPHSRLAQAARRQRREDESDDE